MHLYSDNVANQATFNFKYSARAPLRISEAKTSCWLKTSLKSCKLSTLRSLKLLKTNEKRYRPSSKLNQNKPTWHKRRHRGNWASFCLKQCLFKQKAWTIIRSIRITDNIIIVHLSRTNLAKTTKMKRSYLILIQQALCNKKKLTVPLHKEGDIAIIRLSYPVTASCAGLNW